MLERLPPDYFADGERIAAPDYGPVELRRRPLVKLMNEEVIDRTNARETTGDLDIWVDKNNGSDYSNGLSEDNPIASLERLVEILPRALLHKTVVHIKAGTYSPVTIQGIYSKTQDLRSLIPSFLIEGETALKTLTTGVNTGNPSAVAKGYFDKPVGSPDWTPNEMDNELLVIISGPHAGQVRLILYNTTSRIYFRDSYSSWSVSDVFEIHERKTILDTTKGEFRLWGCTTDNSGLNTPPFVIRNIILDGPNPSLIGCYADQPAMTLFERILVRNGSSIFLNAISNSSMRLIDSALIYPPGFNINFFSGNMMIARSIIKGNVYFQMNLFRSLSFFENYIETGSAIGIKNGISANLTRNQFVGSGIDVASLNEFIDYEGVYDGYSGNNILIRNVKFASLGQVESKNAGSSGISIRNSYASFDSVKGIGNAIYGVELRKNSFLERSGINNTITGTSGDIKPGTQASIAWGVNANDPAELVGVF